MRVLRVRMPWCGCGSRAGCRSRAALRVRLRLHLRLRRGIGQRSVYGQYMLTIASRLDVMNRLGRAMADPTRSRILLSLLESPGYPAELARLLGLTRTNVSNHLTCLRDCGILVAEVEGRRTRYEIADGHLARALEALLDTTLAVDASAPCLDPQCPVAGCCEDGAGEGTGTAADGGSAGEPDAGGGTGIDAAVVTGARS